MKERIEESLLRLFKKNRVLVWYDAQQEFTPVFDALVLPNVLKEKVHHNEFAIKYKVYITNSEQKMLLYVPYERPENQYNWLLDIEESNKVFHTDPAALVLQDIELPIRNDTKEWVKKHLEFFKSKERLRLFKKEQKIETNLERLTLKLCQVVFGSATDEVDDLLQVYAEAFVESRENELTHSLERFKLHHFFWQQVVNIYSLKDETNHFLLKADELSILDFLIHLFRKNWKVTSAESHLNESAIVLINRWKDSLKFERSFIELSHLFEERLSITNLVQKTPIDELIKEDLYEVMDQEIIRALADLINHQSVEGSNLLKMIKERSHSYWYSKGKYSSFYQALAMAIQYKEQQEQLMELSYSSYEEVLKAYTNEAYKVDYYYRKFIQHFRETKLSDILHPLATDIENRYTNKWLLLQSEKWQGFLDKQKEKWYFGDKSQHKFFDYVVKPRFIDAGRKVFVIISDALRYECGVELHQRIAQTENRLSSELDYLCTGLPSYTQLGMAALLPHKKLSFINGDNIVVDGLNSVGTQARDKILKTNAGVKATAITAEEVMQMSSRGDAARQLVQGNDLVYIYHNLIDKVGDDKTTEESLASAVQEELDYLISLIKKISNMNGNQILLTADHGFLYQYKSLEESDYISDGVEGEIEVKNRRYVLGDKLVPNSNFQVYTAEELQVDSSCSIAIPKGINRLRHQGSGSRYVHGGASLQECIIPLLYIQYKREDTIREVEIDVINQANNRITTNHHRVQFYQKEPIGTGVVAREIKAYFATAEEEGKEILSDIFTYTFDKSENRSEDREVEHLFTISSHKAINPTIYLSIESKIKDSNQWELLVQLKYKLSIAIERDFFF